MRAFARSMAYGAATGVAVACIGMAAYAQVDPLAGLLGPPTAAGQPPSAAAILAPPQAAANTPGMRTGFIGVEQAVGASYSAAQTHGVASMATLRLLPKSVAPLPVSARTQNPRALNGKTRLAVPTYVLALNQQGEVRASGAGAGSDITPRASKLSTVLVGVSDEMAMQLANEARADLVRRLTEAGFTVVPQAELDADPDFAKINKLGQKGKGQNGWSVYGPADAPLYAGHPLTNAPLQASGAAINLSSASATLDAVMLQPYLVIDYERLGGSGNRTYSGSAQVSADVHFHMPSAGLSFIYGQRRGLGSGPGGSISAAATGSDELFGVMFEIDDRSDDPAINNTFASLGLGSLYRQSKYYGVEVAPERYQALVRAAFQGLNAALVSEIQKARA